MRQRTRCATTPSVVTKSPVPYDLRVLPPRPPPCASARDAQQRLLVTKSPVPYSLRVLPPRPPACTSARNAQQRLLVTKSPVPYSLEDVKPLSLELKFSRGDASAPFRRFSNSPQRKKVDARTTLLKRVVFQPSPCQLDEQIVRSARRHQLPHILSAFQQKPHRIANATLTRMHNERLQGGKPRQPDEDLQSIVALSLLADLLKPPQDSCISKKNWVTK